MGPEIRSVPQIWVTYDELAEIMGCDHAGAREAVAAIPLDCRKSRDGHTRAKLSPWLTELFFDRLVQRRLDRELAACAGNLRAMRERMEIRSSAAPKYQAAS
ncbi:hypothetical protein DNX69_04465 [Rhodopseudomonas palustris]|uniref:Uncharacterized protein n=1 Tax=Rhodopseudomonas palustris TaxID=1076 RepID=A0A323UMJ7_RHOPL|nr:hypothetical protein [Rhodopseudomonas palustris]PZA13611.1 hypothetical protein DNX69_04465 [Rhodopseudomonas palustris]